jgi:hypothetical protein
MVTHDGMVWEEGDTTSFRRLEGAEKYIHIATTFCIRLLLKALNA